MSKPNSTMAKLMQLKSKKEFANSDVMTDSKYIDKDILCKLSVPALAIAMSGQCDGGIVGGSHQIVGESRTFKTNFGLALVMDFLNADPENICVFGDSERGANTKYWEAFGIDMDRVFHLPLKNVEDMQHKLLYLLEEQIPDTNKVIIFVDSIAQLPSKKEYNDSIEKGEDAPKDMTRAAALNSFWRCITPVINFRDIPLVWINGFYKPIGDKYAEEVLKGGQQGFLSTDNIWFITRSQVKDSAKELLGWNFTLNIRKGRFTKEKLKLPITVYYNGGIDRWSALLEICIATGLIDQSGAWYQRTEKSGIPDAKKRQKKQMDDDFWLALLEQEVVVKTINDYVGVSTGSILTPLEEEMQDGIAEKLVKKTEE